MLLQPCCGAGVVAVPHLHPSTAGLCRCPPNPRVPQSTAACLAACVPAALPAAPGGHPPYPCACPFALAPSLAVQIYAAPLAGGGRAVVLLNTGDAGPTNITVTWQQLGLPAGTAAGVRDLFAERDVGEFEGAVSAAATQHDVAVVKLTPLASGNSSRAADDGWRPWHQLHAQLPPRQHRPSVRGWLLAGAAAAALRLAAVAISIARWRRRVAGSGWRRLGDAHSMAAGTVQLGPAVFVGPAVQVGHGGKAEEQV